MEDINIMEETNITNEILAIVARKRDLVPEYATAHEAYAILKDKQETVEKHIDFSKIMKEFWAAVKEGNYEDVVAYASQLETNARNVAAAAAELAAYAAAAARM